MTVAAGLDMAAVAGTQSGPFPLTGLFSDFDGDGRIDLFVTSIYVADNPRGTGNRLFLNAGDRTFADATDAAGVRDGMWRWGRAPSTTTTTATWISS